MNAINACRTRARQRGVAIIELVVVLPVLLILIMATSEFGRAFVQYNALTKSIRDGGRYASAKALKGSTGVVQINSTLLTETRNLVAYGNIGGTGSPLLPGLAPSSVSVVPGDPGTLVVSAAYPYAPIFSSLPLFQFGSRSTTYTLTAAVNMRAL